MPSRRLAPAGGEEQAQDQGGADNRDHLLDSAFAALDAATCSVMRAPQLGQTPRV